MNVLTKSFIYICLLLTVATLISCTESSTVDIAQKKSTIEEQDSSLLLHVESPDWRDQIIYFVMLDRFQDGDKNNNNFGHNLYRPKELHYFNGGDIQGLIDRIDYIKELGATAIWVTPPNANLWWSNDSKGTGYHGYWATDFKSIDKHFGTLEIYKNLSHELHSNDMYLVQDIVANHVGRFFNYKNGYDAKDTAKHFNLLDGNIPDGPPTQFPFNLNDRNNPEHLEADIYHWTPEITDFYKQNQEYNYQLSGLNDLNTSNPTVREALKDSFGYWIKEVGVDAFRLDTAKFMEPDFINDFLHSKNGLLASAQSTGRESFPVFGEIFETSQPYSDEAEQKIRRFTGTTEKPGLNGLIGFPLYKSVENVFQAGQATSEISYRLTKQMEIYNDPFMVLNFIDNHDVKRFQTSKDTQSIKQALAFIMTIPGIPVIYQGDEQGLLESREAMFAGGFHAKKDKFDQQSELYQFIKRITDVRKSHKALSRGNIEILADNDSRAGVLAYKRELIDGQNKKSVVVIFNTADKRILLSDFDPKLANNESLEVIFTEKFDSPIEFSTQRKITMELSARSIAIFQVNVVERKLQSQLVENKHTIENQYNNQIIEEAIVLTGTTSIANYPLLLVDNGQLDTAKALISDEHNNWKFTLENNDYGTFNHSYVIYDPQTNTTSKPVKFKTKNTKANIQFSISDPIGDDNGKTNDYEKPTDQTYRKQIDIEKVSILAGGSTLELTIKMAELKSDWIAANGFDHVAFTLFFDLPLIKGLTHFPEINSNAPPGFDWNYGHQLFGWGNRIFDAVDAEQKHLGDSKAKSPKLNVNTETREVKITYDAKQFGITNWENTKVYITTWDLAGEGEYRQLTSESGRWNFSSPSMTALSKNKSLILDDLAPILITAKQ